MPQTITDIYQNLCAVTSQKNARLLIAERTGMTWGDLINDSERIVTQSVNEAFQNDMQKLEQGATISRILQKSSFCGRDFQLSDATLEPRADSEILINAVLHYYKDQSPLTICDFGTGTGCLLITLLKEFPHAKGIGTDIRTEACKTAENNAAYHDVHNRAGFISANWAVGVDNQFDCIVSNPPYIAEHVMHTLDESVKDHDPHVALAGGQDGCDPYRALFPRLNDLLTPGGRAFFEIGYDQAELLTSLAQSHDLIVHTVHRDSGGRDRCLEISSVKNEIK